jgi:hypothetical protein
MQIEACMRIGLAKLISIAFILVGICVLVQLFAEHLTLSSGNDTVGRVTNVTPVHRRSGRVFNVSFTYTDSTDDIIRGDNAFMEWAPIVGQDFPIRISSFGPFHFAVPRGNKSSASGFICPAVFMCGWCGLALLFAIFIWFARGRERDPNRQVRRRW